MKSKIISSIADLLKIELLTLECMDTFHELGQAHIALNALYDEQKK